MFCLCAHQNINQTTCFGVLYVHLSKFVAAGHVLESTMLVESSFVIKPTSWNAADTIAAVVLSETPYRSTVWATVANEIILRLRFWRASEDTNNEGSEGNLSWFCSSLESMEDEEISSKKGFLINILFRRRTRLISAICWYHFMWSLS